MRNIAFVGLAPICDGVVEMVAVSHSAGWPTASTAIAIARQIVDPNET
jgi:hypothetical protein